MTHVTRKEKSGVSFVFRTHRDEVPQFSGDLNTIYKGKQLLYKLVFSGFLVEDYGSYSVLESNRDQYLDITQKANDTARG